MAAGDRLKAGASSVHTCGAPRDAAANLSGQWHDIGVGRAVPAVLLRSVPLAAMNSIKG